MYLIIDTETTGLPILFGFDKFPPPTDHRRYDTSRMVHIAWKIIDKNYNEVCFKNFIIKRDGFEINNTQFHGITNEISDEKGVDITVALSELEKDLENCTTIIAHNLKFDYNVIVNHCYRYDRFLLTELMESKEKYCTMKQSTNILKLPTRYASNKFKYPSLKELYQYYFKTDFEGAHDAYYDVEACCKCFCELISSSSSLS